MRIVEGLVLVDINGVLEKIIVVESGVFYFVGKFLLIFNKEIKDLDVNKWFFYYLFFMEFD